MACWCVWVLVCMHMARFNSCSSMHEKNWWLLSMSGEYIFWLVTTHIPNCEACQSPYIHKSSACELLTMCFFMAFKSAHGSLCRLQMTSEYGVCSWKVYAHATTNISMLLKKTTSYQVITKRAHNPFVNDNRNNKKNPCVKQRKL
jgi:hypothetical protein